MIQGNNPGPQGLLLLASLQTVGFDPSQDCPDDVREQNQQVHRKLQKDGVEKERPRVSQLIMGIYALRECLQTSFT